MRQVQAIMQACGVTARNQCAPTATSVEQSEAEISPGELVWLSTGMLCGTACLMAFVRCFTGMQGRVRAFPWVGHRLSGCRFFPVRALLHPATHHTFGLGTLWDVLGFVRPCPFASAPTKFEAPPAPLTVSAHLHLHARH